VGVAVAIPLYQQQKIAVSQRLLSKGIKFESLGQIDAAEKTYQKLYTKYPQAAEAAEALFRFAKIKQYDRQDEQRALLGYLQLEHDYPENRLVLKAREAAAHIVKYSFRDYSRAIEFYYHLIELGGGQPDRYYYEVGDCYFRLKNYPQARIELELLLEKYPDSSLAVEAQYRRAELFLLEGDGAAAQKVWQQLIEKYPKSHYRVLAEINLAKQLEERGLYEEALKRYQWLATKNQTPLLREKITHLQKRIAKKKGLL